MNILKNIKGFYELSLMEWKGVVSSIIFLGGCNFRCIYCHNYDMAFNPKDIPSKDLDDILNNLDNRKGWVDGVVISGGEPTIYGEELIDFLLIFKKRGLKTKIYTNGYNYDVIEKIVDKKIVDEISMDIKHIPGKYEEIIKVKLPELEDRILASINILKRAKINKEFRLTAVKGVHSLEDIKKISELISPEKIILQNVTNDCVRDAYKELITPFTDEEIKCFEKKIEVDHGY
ncbi:MAG: anaerobic ribonucleoside-triphosphate reductase activating protein [Proteobacteria bacterium]|nr:anaerobic ribonucleoside-triphosphate reductase activating protein [Pseudomonadota bacterium]